LAAIPICFGWPIDRHTIDEAQGWAAVLRIGGLGQADNCQRQHQADRIRWSRVTAASMNDRLRNFSAIAWRAHPNILRGIEEAKTKKVANSQRVSRRIVSSRLRSR
jgi:hypothetical protein